MGIIKTQTEIIKIKEASRIVAKTHRVLKEFIKEGVTLLEIDALAEKTILDEGAIPTFKDYGGFPNSICASVNEVVVHGIPSNYALVEGDVVTIDVGADKDGYCGDAAFTVGIGKISERDQLLIDTCEEALSEAIKFAKPGVSLGALGAHIESFAIKNGFTSTAEYTGHGIGADMHEDPTINNVGFKGGMKLMAGMTICIEPIFLDGPDNLYVDPIDQWTVRTVYGGNSVQVEHTVLITANGGEILTKE